MKINKEKVRAFANWMANNKRSGEIGIALFFSQLCMFCEKGSDPVIIVSRVLGVPVQKRPYRISDEDVYTVMLAFSEFHEMGGNFRCRWNAAEISVNYAKYIEEGKIKHVAQPHKNLIVPFDKNEQGEDEEGEG